MSCSTRILIVDDNVGNLSMYADFFRSLGYEIELASDAIRGLEAMAVNRPDLALVDVQMPGMDGLEMVRHLRAHADPGLAAMPVVALTALGMPGDEQRCLEAGFDAYLCKPVSLRVLAATVERLLAGVAVPGRPG